LRSDLLALEVLVHKGSINHVIIVLACGSAR